MYLEYGINDNGELVYIGQAKRGLTALRCPYCGGALLARKGEIMAHHFAHAGETCRQVERDPDTVALPAYDNFNLHLPGKAVEQLHKFATNDNGYDVQYLERLELITLNRFKGHGTWEPTHKGKLVLGDLSLMLFNEFQEPLIIQRHAELETRAADAYEKPRYEARLAEIEAEAQPMLDPKWGGGVALRPEYRARLSELNNELWATRNKLKAITMDFDTALADLRIYRAQVRRVLSCSLYFLSINGGQLHKIGVTTRPIEERVSEIVQDLRPHISDPKVEIIDTWAHRGNVELYFKYRYKQHNRVMGQLNEYYAFDDIKAVIRDLRRMKPKQLNDTELAILSGQPAGIEERVRLDSIEVKRRAMIRVGMQKAAKRGKQIGRPSGGETAQDFLAKPSSLKVREALDQGMSVRQAAKFAGVSVNTVQKVKNAGS